jgi:hypothetical protein
MPQNNLPDGLNARDIQRIRSFVSASSGIPQLIHARVHAITMLWNMVKGGVEVSSLPELEADEIQVFLRTSEHFAPDNIDKSSISKAA